MNNTDKFIEKENQIRKIEEMCKHKLPEKFKELYLNNDIVMIGGKRCLALSEIILLMEASIEKDNLERYDFNNKVNQEAYCIERVPFMQDHRMNNVYIDYIPGNEGKVGQIITYGIETNDIMLCSNSFDEFKETMEAKPDIGENWLDYILMENLLDQWSKDTECWLNKNSVRNSTRKITGNNGEMLGELFVKDGIMNYEEYLKDDNNPRILYITKEAYTNAGEKGKEISNLADDTIDCVKGLFWSRLSEWTYGIQNTNKYEIYDFNKIKEGENGLNSKTEMEKALRRVAVINLKKSDGDTETNMNDLTGYFNSNNCKEKYINYLEEQINIINPQIIVCCGTFSIFNDIFKEKIEKGKSMKRINKFKLKYGEAFLIDYYHPSWPNSSELLYNTLMINYQKTLD